MAKDDVLLRTEHKPRYVEAAAKAGSPSLNQWLDQAALDAAMHATTSMDRELQDTPVERTPGKRRIGRIGMRNN